MARHLHAKEDLHLRLWGVDLELVVELVWLTAWMGDWFSMIEGVVLFLPKVERSNEEVV